MGLIRPRPYYVSFEAATPDERGPGWFWVGEDRHGDEVIRGPYYTRRDAEDAIDSFMFKLGEPL